MLAKIFAGKIDALQNIGELLLLAEIFLSCVSCSKLINGIVSRREYDNLRTLLLWYLILPVSVVLDTILLSTLCK